MDKHLDDAEKIRRFEATVLPHLDAAYSLARWLTRNVQDAEDVTQMACVRAFRFFGSFQGGDERAWLLTIVRNTYYNAWRDQQHQRQEVQLEEEESFQHASEVSASLSDSADPEQVLARKDAKKIVNQALHSLPNAFREVLVLKELSELSYKEIAELIGIPMGTVMSRLARGRKLLLEYLKGEGNGGVE